MDINDLRKKAEKGDAQAQFDLAYYYFPVKRTLWEPEEGGQDEKPEAQESDPLEQESDPLEPEVLEPEPQDCELIDWECEEWSYKESEYEDEAGQEEVWRQEQYAEESRWAEEDEGRQAAMAGKKAMFWYCLAAKQGHVEAQYIMGVGYENGLEVPQDLADAVMWYRLAAVQGHEYAQAELRYLEENIFPLGAAEQGDANAQFQIGEYHRTKTDPVLASKWYHLAAEQRYEDALKEIDEELGFPIVEAEQGDQAEQLKLGLAYDLGQEVPNDCADAAMWYHRAAEQGHAAAQYMLGDFYYFGQGVPLDHIQAYAWTTLAANQGNERAVKFRETILEEMTPEEKAEGERLSGEYAKTFVK